MSGAGALYVHVPFCRRKCSYCDFASRATPAGDPVPGRYLESLLSQLESMRSLGILDACGTAYVGGGTPTLLGARGLARLVDAVRRACPSLGELSVEANPDSLGDDVLSALVGCGATRVSMGVQSLDDGELAALGRVHDAALARDRVSAAVASGLDVSVDLMCAIPLQTDGSWRRTLGEVVSLGPGHVSVYPLAIEEGTPLGRNYAGEDPAWNDEGVQAERMEVAEEVLRAAGYHRYEVASYALGEAECAHNKAYWTGIPYLGLGTAASSMLDAAGYDRLCKACPRLPARPADAVRVRLRVEDGANAVARDPSLSALRFAGEWLDASQALAEDLMLGMRLSRGVDVRMMRGFPEVVERLVARGLLARDGSRLVPTHDGWLLGNELYGALWDLAGSPVREF